MTLGGRPKKEGGHTPKRLSLNKETCEGLNKLDKGKRSEFVEKALCPALRQLDPGPSCEVLERIDRILDSEMGFATSRRDYEKVSALAVLANSLEPCRRLCRVTSEEEKALQLWSDLIKEQASAKKTWQM